MVEKIMENYVLLTLNTTVTSYDLWMCPSKPKLCNFLLNSSLMNFYLDFHFMCLYILFLWFQMLHVVNNNQQNKMHICVYVILLLWWLISLLWVFFTVLVVVIMLCMWGLRFLCFAKFPIIMVSWVFTSSWSSFHIPPWTLMFTMTLIVKHFMGKVGHYNSLVSLASLMNWSKELLYWML